MKLCECSLAALVVTCDGELVGLAADVEVQPAAPLGVVAAAEARHALRALLVDVHVTCCNTGTQSAPGFIFHPMYSTRSKITELLKHLTEQGILHFLNIYKQDLQFSVIAKL